jgi:HSP20 family protein
MSSGLFSIIPKRFDYPSLSIHKEFNDIFNFLDGGISRGRNTNLTMPRANVSRTQDGFCVEMASPGFSRGDFNIDIDNGTLNISVESDGENVDSNKKFTSREFSYSSFSRSWRLPESINAEAVSASYESGILTVNIPTIDTTHKKLTINID